MAKPRIVRINETFQTHCGDGAANGGVRNEEKWKENGGADRPARTRTRKSRLNRVDIDREKAKNTKWQIGNLNEAKRELREINFTLIIDYYLAREGTNRGHEMRLKRGERY